MIHGHLRQQDVDQLHSNLQFQDLDQEDQLQGHLPSSLRRFRATAKTQAQLLQHKHFLELPGVLLRRGQLLWHLPGGLNRHKERHRFRLSCWLTQQDLVCNLRRLPEYPAAEHLLDLPAVHLRLVRLPDLPAAPYLHSLGTNPL